MIELNGHDLTIPQLWRIALSQQPCRLAATARRRMRQSRAVVEKLAVQPRAIYGINTGFGPLSGMRVPPGDLVQHQLNLLHHLSVGQGALFSAEETRAIMVARGNALARGYSGIRVEVVELLLAALIVGAALLMQVETSFRILGYPGLAIIFFLLAACGALALIVAVLKDDEG